MAGWIVVLGSSEPPDDKAARLARVFSVSSMPDLAVRKTMIDPVVHLIQWGWGDQSMSDVSVSLAKDATTAALLEGYITSPQSDRRQRNDPRATSAEALLEQGESAVLNFNGSFGCVRVDLANRRAMAWTDRIASRPIWIADQDGTLYIGNSTAAVATVMERQPNLNPAGVWALFQSSRHVGSNGLYSGFRNLHGGECARMSYADSRANCRVQKWWSLEFKPEPGPSAREWGAEIAAGLQQSANRLTSTSSSPHLFLSGGLDSRLAMAALGSAARAVTMTSTPDNMNVRIARRAAIGAGAEHTTMERSPNWYLDRFEAAALLAGGNYNLVHAHYLAPIPMLRRPGVSASFLLGDLLENFNKHYFKPNDGEPWRFVPDKIPEFYHRLYSYTHPDPTRLRSLFQPHIVNHLETSWKEAFIELCREVQNVSSDDRDCFDALFRWHNCSLCPTYLMLECIRPLSKERNLMFDNGMLDLLMRIPAEVRGSGRLHPWTLWRLNKSLALLPDSNYWLPPIAPGQIKRLARKARPFLGRVRRKVLGAGRKGKLVTTTEGSWHMLATRYQKDRDHREFVEDILFDPACFPSDIFVPGQIRHVWEQFLADTSTKKHYFEINMLLSFGLLHRLIPSRGLA